MCYQQAFEGDMDWRIVERLSHVLPFIKTIQLFGGEPLLYPRVKDLFTLASNNACEIQVITNGSLLTSKSRELIRTNNTTLVKISLEASTQETYESIRGGNLEKILSNIERLAMDRKRPCASHPEIQINFVAMERNIRELPTLVARAANIGVDSLLVLYVNCGHREDLARESLYLHQELSDEYMQKALEVGKQLGIRVTTPGFFSKKLKDPDCDRTCHSPWKNCLIDVNGNLSFCCGGAGPLGNILETPFDELWHNQTITNFRRLVNTNEQPECCKTCRVKGRNHREAAFHIRNPKIIASLSLK
jgi:radical SAM protein with 4Fe4S-binding SPASM domain